MTIEINSNKDNPKCYNFNRTEILVALSTLGSERYISRSQAKKILQNLEKFEIITLDFIIAAALIMTGVFIINYKRK